MPRSRAVPQPTTADGYIRVSRRGGREGESFIAPEVQRRRSLVGRSLHGVEIVQWWEEIDQSGAKRDRPMFQQALARCEAGETGGIVVARLDRFARSAVDALESIKRLNAAGARLVSVEDNFDGSTPMGRFAIGILTLIAELELERIRENWSDGDTRSCWPRRARLCEAPDRLRAGQGRRLLPIRAGSPAVAEVFRRRAVGASWASWRSTSRSRGRSADREPALVEEGVAGLVMNPVYLGAGAQRQDREGERARGDRHPGRVRRTADQRQRSRAARRIACRESDCWRVLVCAGCGHTLKITGTPTGRRGALPDLLLHGRYATGPCPARASARASLVDPYVEEVFLNALQAEAGCLPKRTPPGNAGKAAAHVDEAEHELDLYLSSELMTVIGQDRFTDGVETANRRSTKPARTSQSSARKPSLSATSQTEISSPAWPQLTIPDKRRLLHGFLDKVVLCRSWRARAAGTTHRRACRDHHARWHSARNSACPSDSGQE